MDSNELKVFTSLGFKEGEPQLWAPTFKLNIEIKKKSIQNEERYNFKRIPSWTDRIIYKSGKIGNKLNKLKNKIIIHNGN